MKRAAGLHSLFAAQAARTPGATALVHQRERTTYAELAGRVRGLAARLRAMGVGPEVPVGVCLERTPDLVAALLAVMEAGGFYVPLDPAYPRERLGFMLADSGAAVVVTGAELAGRLPEHGSRLLRIGEEEGLPAGEPPGGGAGGGNLAYLIYTSGSTGRPKGVALEHGSAVAFARWARQVFSGEERRGVLAATSIAFDLSVFELFVTLAWGGAVILAANALELPDLPAAGEVTLINTVPSAMAELVRMGAVPPAVRTVNLAGEPLKNSLAQAIYALPHVRRVLNLYGPSEDTTYSTWTEVEKGAAGEPAIGRPIAGTRAWLADAAGDLAADGEIGEILLSGAGLARGYFRRPGLTAERFAPDPFSGAPGQRLYRTGDLGRRRPDGAIEFLGRIDHQVKIRGFRIELGEIEVTLESHPRVREAVVLARESGPGEKLLAAYVVLEGEQGVKPLRAWLGERLPSHMIPSVFVALERMPRTPNGKVDRGALPDPPAAAGSGGAPRGALEATLAGLFAEVLGIEGVGVEDSFFALGGDSLRANRVLARVRESLRAELPPGTLFEAPTVAALAVRIAQASPAGDGAGSRVPPLRPLPRVEDPALSYAQQRLWLHESLAGGSPLYNIPALLELDGHLDPSLLERALAEVVRRHEPLRTRYLTDPATGEPRQRIEPGPAPRLPVVDLSALPEDARAAEAQRVEAAQARRLFSLGDGPVFRAVLLRAAARRHLLLLTIHHIAADSWSLEILRDELRALYPAFAQGLPSPLPELRVRYADFALWQRRWLEGGELATQLAWWRRRLAGAPPALALSAGRPRSRPAGSRGGRLRRELAPELSDAASALARREGCTLFQVVFAAFVTLLHRWSGEEDLAVGVPAANRNRTELEDLVGLFVNLVVLRCDLAGDPPFAELLGRVRETVLGALSHQDLPFERLVAELRPERAAGRIPLVQALFALDREARQPLAPGLSVLSREGESGTAKADLSLYVIDTGAGLAAVLEHDLDLYDRSIAARLLEQYELLLTGALAAPRARLSDLPLLTPAEEAQLAAWSRTPGPEPGEALVPRLVLARAAEAPGAVALAAGDEVWTYGEMAAAALRLAARLRALGVGPEVRAGLYLQRSPELVVAALAVLLAGGAYLPLDPEVPPERVSFILEDAAAPVVVTRRELAGELPEGARQTVLLEEGLEDLEDLEDLEAEETSLEQTAYVIYTSGSTGRPKGVQVPHAGLLGLVRWHCAAYGLTPADRASVLAAPGFDASVWEIWPALAAGASLRFTPAEARLDPALLIDWLAAEGVTVGFLPTPLAEEVLDAPWPAAAALRALLTGGDRLGRRPARGFPCALHNHYGPTECSVVATAGPVEPERREAPDIGRPISGLRLRLLDRRQRPVPVGAAGEICLGGAGLARGYAGRPDLTAERFIPDPSGDPPGGRLYRTGDLARWRPDGRLDFLGRVDFQIKIRGFRIEPGEIEAALARQPGVREAVVAARPGAAGEPRLVAWVVGADGPPPAAEELRERLARDLPPYMVPAAFVTLDRLPLTPHGKIDRRALPEPVAAGDGELPQGAVQEILAAIWTDLLGVERVGPQSDFFALGGQSLLATQAASRLRRAFGVELPLQQLFAHPTLAGMAQSVETALSLGRLAEAPPVVPVPRDGELPLSFSQERLWFLERFEPGTAAYNIPVLYPFSGPLDIAALAHALREVARRHEALRTTFAEGESGVPRQVIAAEPRLPLPVADLGALPPAARAAEVERLAANAAAVPFDLEAGPLIRALLLRCAPDEHALFLNIHHSVADGWSFNVLERDLSAFYTACVERAPSSLPELPVQYADYAVWQRRWVRGPVLAEQLAWWLQHLAGAPDGLALPSDRPRPSTAASAAVMTWRALPEPLVAAVHALARRAGATPFMIWLAAYASLLSRFARQEDLVVGAPVANRNRAETEDLIGFFVNTLALRTDLSGRPAFAEVLRRVRAAALGAYTCQDLPLEKIVEELHPDRDPARTPLFRVFLAVRNLVPRPLAPGLDLELRVVPTGTAKLDLVLEVLERAHGATLFCEHRSSLYDRSTIERLLRGFEALLASAVDDPGLAVADLPLLDLEELRSVLRVWDEPPRLAPAAPSGFEEPASPMERELAALWTEVLGASWVGRIGRNDDFFELGGHSLLAARVLSRVRSRWGVALPVRVAFESPTLAGLAARIDQALHRDEAGETLGRPVPVPHPRGDRGLPLSFAQQRLWFVQQLDPGGTALNVPCLFGLRGPLAPAALAASLAGLVRRHEPLRTTFAERAGTPVQIVGLPVAPPLPLADLSALPAGARPGEAERILGGEARRPFDLRRGPLLRPLLLRLAPEEHRLLLCLHHIVADGWSVDVLLSELGSLYAAAVEGRQAALPPLPLQYADYAVWQRRWLSGGRLAGEIAWWRERLAGMEPVRLPLDRPLPAERARRGAFRELELPAGLSAGVRDLAQREGATLFMTVLAAFLALLHRETGQTDLVVGTPVANRERAEIEGLIGVFINNLVLRNDLSGDPGFGELVRRVRDTSLAAYAHQETPFDKLVEELEPKRDTARTPLFQAMFSLQPAAAPPPCFAGVRMEILPVHTGTAQFDLTLFVHDRGTDLAAALEYDTDLFEERTADRLLARLQTLLAAAVADPEQPLSRLLAPPEPSAAGAAALAQPAAPAPRARLSERLQGTLDDRRSRLSDEQKALLARRLRGRKGSDGAVPAAAARALVPIDPSGSRPPFFCVHPAGGDILCFHPLARHLGADLPFYGLQSPGIAADAEPYGSLEEMAAGYIAEIRQVQTSGPYRLGGWSLGGVVAFEMAQQLVRAGQEVELLAILDTVPRLDETQPAAAEPGFWEDDARWLLDIAVYAEGLWGKSLGIGYEDLRALGDGERLACCAERLAALQLLPPGAGTSYLARLLRVFKANVRAGLSYRPRPYPGRITLFRAADAPAACPALGWEAYSPEPVEVHVCPGTHVTLLAETHAAALAERLRQCLDRRTVEARA